MANLAQDKQQTSATKKPQGESSLAMPLDQETSLFKISKQGQQKMVDQTRQEFLSAKTSSSKET
jgi:hypothetical protein